MLGSRRVVSGLKFCLFLSFSAALQRNIFITYLCLVDRLRTALNEIDRGDLITLLQEVTSAMQQQATPRPAKTPHDDSSGSLFFWAFVAQDFSRPVLAKFWSSKYLEIPKILKKN